MDDFFAALHDRGRLAHVGAERERLVLRERLDLREDGLRLPLLVERNGGLIHTAVDCQIALSERNNHRVIVRVGAERDRRLVRVRVGPELLLLPGKELRLVFLTPLLVSDLGDSASAVVEGFDRVGSDSRVGLKDLKIR